MGPVLIRHVGSVDNGSRFGFKQKKKKMENTERSSWAVLKRAGMVGMLMRENKNSQVGKKKGCDF